LVTEGNSVCLRAAPLGGDPGSVPPVLCARMRRSSRRRCSNQIARHLLTVVPRVVPKGLMHAHRAKPSFLLVLLVSAPSIADPIQKRCQFSPPEPKSAARFRRSCWRGTSSHHIQGATHASSDQRWTNAGAGKPQAVCANERRGDGLRPSASALVISHRCRGVASYAVPAADRIIWSVAIIRSVFPIALIKQQLRGMLAFSDTNGA